MRRRRQKWEPTDIYFFYALVKNVIFILFNRILGPGQWKQDICTEHQAFPRSFMIVLGNYGITISMHSIDVFFLRTGSLKHAFVICSIQSWIHLVFRIKYISIFSPAICLFFA